MKFSSKLFDKLIFIFIIIQPFIDAITMYQIRSPIKIISISVVTRGLFLVIISFWLYKKCRKKLLFYILLGYFVIDVVYIILFTNNSIYQEIANLFQIFYLPLVILFFQLYENKKINLSLIFKVYLIYLNFIIVPYFLHIGVYANEYYPGKSGYYGLFNGGNEISAVILAMLPWIIHYLSNNGNVFLKIFTAIETIFCIYLIGTKTILLGSIIVLLYFLIPKIFKIFKKDVLKNILISILIATILLILIIIVVPSMPLYKNILLALKFFNVNSLTDFLKIEVIDNIIFSGRLNILENINEIYCNSQFITYIFGLGETTLLNLKLIEIDIFDIFYSIGILGIFIYLMIMIKGIKKAKLKSIYLFSFILLIFVSLFTGHILTSTCVSIYLGLNFILTKNN